MDAVRGAIASGPGRIIFMVAGVAILGLVLYYVYKWLSGDAEKQDMVVYTSPSSGLVANSGSPQVFENENVPALYGGGDYSISTWVYISNWGINKSKNKTFLTLSGGSAAGFNTLVMYFGQFVNKLGVRVSYETADSTNAQATLDQNQMALLNAGTTPYSDSAPDFKKCDIEMVDLQRWVNITTVISGRTVDVYIDGKLSRSCVLDGMFKVDGSNTRLSLGGPNGFGGFIGSTRCANFAYAPDQVYRIYQGGPLDTSIWSLIKSYFDPNQYSFSVKRNNQELISATT